MRRLPADSLSLFDAPPGAPGDAVDGPQEAEAMRARVRGAIADFLSSRRAGRPEPEVYVRRAGRVRRRGDE